MRRGLIVAVAATGVVVLAGGYAVADAADVVPGFLTTTAARPSAATTPGPAAGSPTWPATQPLAAVLGTLSATAPEPSRAGVARVLRTAMRRLGPAVSADVVDVATGHVLYGAKASTPRTPASTTKLLTAQNVLTNLGPGDTLATRVVQGSSAHRIVLVGGGDSRLAAGAGSGRAVFGHAGLGDLAAATASALRTAGRTTVAVGLDDSLFTGPRINPHWAPTDPPQGIVGAVSPLGLAARAPTPGKPSPADPAMTAAAAFVHALRHDGITVKGALTRVRARTAAAELAVVHSATIAQLLAVTLATSDNTEAEVLARLGARAAGRPASFIGAAAENVRRAKALGVPTKGIRLYDGSGLSRADLIPARTLAGLLVAAARGSSPASRALFAGLPIAGFTGTLAARYQSGADRAGGGVVRAKTGTLSGVSSLAGITVDRSGRLLVFVVMAERLDPAKGAAVPRGLLDRAASALARCGCQ